MANLGKIVPSSQQPIAGPGGIITPAWLRFLNAIVAAPGAIVTVTPGASPYTFSAGESGTLRIAGGTVSSIVLTRSGTSVSFGTTATVPVVNGDSVVTTYSVAPTINFIPG